MAGIFGPELIERVRAASDIVDVIGAAIPLKKAGVNFTALCPFHREKTPSFHVNPRKQTFHCFGCHKGGDVFTFIREYESVEFPEAFKRLAERAGITVEFDNDPKQKEHRFLKDKLLEIHEQITLRWHAALKNDAAGQRARDYLAQRQVSAEAINTFRLGYALEPWEDLVNWAKSKNYDLEIMDRAGLVVRKEGTDHYYGRFRDRLMFPICDEQGRVVAFSGRILPGDDDPRKYVNSPETPLFHKSRLMFGLDKSKRALLDTQRAVICEGQLDLITCFMAGVQNMVAPQGTAFTGDHARILKRYVKEVVLCFDSDNAGQKATVSALDDLVGSGLAIRVATIPPPHDPDSYIKEHGAAAFQALIDNAEGFFDYYLKRLCATNDISTDKGQQEVVRAMAEAIGKTGDAFLVDRYARKTAATMGVNPLDPITWFRKAVAKAAAKGGYRDEAHSPVLPEQPAKPNAQELWLLKAVLAEDDLIPFVRAHLELSWVENRWAQQVLAARLAPGPDGQTLQPVQLLGQLEPHAAQLLTECLAEERTLKNMDQIARDAILRLRNAAIDKELAQLNQQLTSPELPAEETARLLHERAALAATKREPLTPLPQFSAPDDSAEGGYS